MRLSGRAVNKLPGTVATSGDAYNDAVPRRSTLALGLAWKKLWWIGVHSFFVTMSPPSAGLMKRIRRLRQDLGFSLENLNEERTVYLIDDAVGDDDRSFEGGLSAATVRYLRWSLKDGTQMKVCGPRTAHSRNVSPKESFSQLSPCSGSLSVAACISLVASLTCV